MSTSHKNPTEPITHGVLDKVQFGDRFGKLLIEKGFTVESFSFASGISETTIKEIKYGRRLPSLPKYMTIIETLHISDILLLQNSISPEYAAEGIPLKGYVPEAGHASDGRQRYPDRPFLSEANFRLYDRSWVYGTLSREPPPRRISEEAIL